MSYKTYTTQGFVCGSSHSNTSDRSYLIFTQDAGMVWATARSVREERSKQRYALQDFSRIRVSLLKGKSGWRIGSVEPYGNPFLSASERVQRGCINFLFAQVRRYVHGEIALPRTYADLEWLVEHQESYPDKNILQHVFLLRLLSELGYVAVTDELMPLLNAASIEEALGAYHSTMETRITHAIEAGAQASHL